jgi:Flp pilus assembly protein CpaB
MVAFPIDRQSSVAYALQEGDFVDVLMTVSFIDLDPEFQTILPNKFAFIERTLDQDTGIETVRVGEEVEDGRFVIEIEEFPALEWAREAQRPRRVAQLTVQSAKVVKVGPWLEEPPPPVVDGEAPPPEPLPDIVSLAVLPQDALVLLWARQTEARMELALRAAGDEKENHSSEAVTLQYMLTRFNIAVPPKLEFGIDKSAILLPTPTPLPPPPPPS